MQTDYVPIDQKDMGMHKATVGMCEIPSASESGHNAHQSKLCLYAHQLRLQLRLTSP